MNSILTQNLSKMKNQNNQGKIFINVGKHPKEHKTHKEKDIWYVSSSNSFGESSSTIPKSLASKRPGR